MEEPGGRRRTLASPDGSDQPREGHLGRLRGSHDSEGWGGHDLASLAFASSIAEFLTVLRSLAQTRLRLPSRQRVFALLGLYVLYVAAAVLGDTVVKIHDVTPVWPAAGVSLVGLYWLGPSAAPVISPWL